MLRKLKMNKKGQAGLDLVGGTMKKLLVLAVVAIAVILALVSLQDSNLFTTGSTADNQTDNIVGNVTTATADFFSNSSTFMSILVAVVVILFISIIIFAVQRFGGSGRSGL